MTDELKSQNNRYLFFQEMIACVPNLYVWCYDLKDPSLEIPDIDNHKFRYFFLKTGLLEFVLNHAKDHTTPLAIGTYIGMVWYAVLEKNDGSLSKVYIMGPVYTLSKSNESIEEIVADYERHGMELRYKRSMIRALQKLPIIPQKQLDQYAIMLHFCVTGEHLAQTDVKMLIDKQLDERTAQTNVNYQKLWYIFHQFSVNLKKGNIAFLSSPEIRNINVESLLLSPEINQIAKPLRMQKNAALIFTMECAHAGIEGGLTPEAAYSLAKKYILSIESDRTSMELDALLQNMYTDYMQMLVTINNANIPKYSPEVQIIKDYITIHLEDDLSLEVLASLVGYTEYYLSRKFKSETGIALKDYIRKSRLDYATILLVTTNVSIQTIAERLGFCSRSHFSDAFQKAMGISPSDYRANKKS